MSKEQTESWVNVPCLIRHRYFQDPTPQTCEMATFSGWMSFGGMARFSSDCYVSVGSVCKSEYLGAIEQCV